MRFYLKGWPWIWIALATGALLAEYGFDHLGGTVIFGVSLGAIFSMVGLYLNSHLLRGRWKIPALGALVGLCYGVFSFWGKSPVSVVGPALFLIMGLFLGCVLQSLIYFLPGQRPQQSPTAPTADPWRSLGLTRVTGKGAQVLAVQGTSRPVAELKHGGDTDQYLEFSPDDRVLASWVPGKVEIFSTSDGSSLGVLKERALLGFSRDGQQVLAVYQSKIERYSLSDLGRFEVESVEQTKPDWRSLGKDWVFSLQTGFGLSVTSPKDTIAFPYRHRVCVSRGLLAVPGAHCVRLENLKGEELWSSPDVGRDVTSTGFTNDGRRLAFGTMGGSLFFVDTETNEVRQQCLADGEIRCLAVSKDGLVAVGCADLSSKVWIFDGADGQPKHVVDSYSDTWGVAFSHDGQTLASGHESGVIKLWSRSSLPVARWLEVRA